MNPTDIAMIGAIATAASVVVQWLFRTPKEQVGELQQRVALLEGMVNGMGREYAGNHARHDQALITLTAAINKLTDRFDAYMGTNHGRKP